jgi:ElaB/YqjD/DUF883 family membrane-anchored ribosome-binding protein
MDDRTAGVNEDAAAARAESPETTDVRTHEIRAEIEQTRGDMSETLDAIQEKLRPGNLVSEATDRVRNVTTDKVRQMASSATDQAGRVADVGRQNWIPAALIGVGTAWLLMNRSGSRSQEYESVYGVVRDRPYGAVGTRGYAEPADTTSPAGAGAEGVSGMAGRVTSRASEMADETRSTVRRSTRRAQNQLQRMIRENPLMVGAAAAVLGAAVGLALPETERENELMGETRENVMERGKEAAKGAVEKVKDAASKTVGDTITGNT